MSTPVPAERPPSLWEDLLEIFYAPTAVFQRRRETPAFGLALIIFVVLSVGLFLAFKSIIGPMMESEVGRSMAQAAKKNPQITPEMIEKFKENSQRFAVFGVAGITLVAPLIMGLILWVIGKFLESKAELGQLMVVATYGYYPKLLEAISNAVQLLILPEDSIRTHFDISLGIGRFIDPDQHPMLLALLGRLDLFTIWVTVLFAIGLSVMGKIPRGRAAIGAAAMWLIGAIPQVLGAWRAM